MSIGYNVGACEASDSTTTTESHGWCEQSLGELVQLSERQVHSEHYPGSGGHRHESKKRNW